MHACNASVHTLLCCDQVCCDQMCCDYDALACISARLRIASPPVIVSAVFVLYYFVFVLFFLTQPINYPHPRPPNTEVCGTGGSVRFPTAHTDKRTGYQVPDSAVYSLRGTDSRGRRVEVDLPVPSVNVVERLDVLAELPWVLRQIIKAFIAKPYFYVFLNRIEAVIRVEGLPEVRCKGVIVHEILALNAGPDAPM
jgi:hypothetical protein